MIVQHGVFVSCLEREGHKVGHDNEIQTVRDKQLPEDSLLVSLPEGSDETINKLGFQQLLVFDIRDAENANHVKEVSTLPSEPLNIHDFDLDRVMHHFVDVLLVKLFRDNFLNIFLILLEILVLEHVEVVVNVHLQAIDVFGVLSLIHDVVECLDHLRRWLAQHLTHIRLRYEHFCERELGAETCHFNY